jgi:hypothetical protein
LRTNNTSTIHVKALTERVVGTAAGGSPRFSCPGSGQCDAEHGALSHEVESVGRSSTRWQGAARGIWLRALWRPECRARYGIVVE